ncbi:hypothetical protein HDU76_010370, partial [Blyttiomyces sp. JEL0837]
MAPSASTKGATANNTNGKNDGRKKSQSWAERKVVGNKNAEYATQEKQQSSRNQQSVQHKSQKDQHQQQPKDQKKGQGKKVDVKSDALSVEPIPLWHTIEIETIPDISVYTPDMEPRLLKEFEKAKTLYEEEVAKYDKIKFQSESDRNFMSTVLKSGTTTDKVSAVTLLIQESPVHTLALLRDQMINGMARKKSRREAILAIDAIKDLATGSLLPDRHLKYFRDQPLFSPKVTPRHLILWYFEDSLKKVYFEFLKLLEELSKDPLGHVKSKMLVYISDLLSSKPEQESNLLALLVNKLGDNDGKISSKAGYLLSAVLEKHPAMKDVVVKEVERFLFRQNVGKQSQYNALTFLNQVVLSNRDTDVVVANHLIDVYFAFFDLLVRKLRGDDEDEGNGKFKGKKDVSGKGGKKGKGKKANYKRQQHGKKGGPPPKKLTAEEAAGAGGGDLDVAGVGDDGEEQGATQQHKNSEGMGEIEGIDSRMMAALLTGVNR